MNFKINGKLYSVKKELYLEVVKEGEDLGIVDLEFEE